MQAYLFDFDGTLVNSMPHLVSGLLAFLDKEGIKYDNDIIKTVIPLGYRGTAEFFKKRGLKASIDYMVEHMTNNAKDLYANVIPAKEGVIETLVALKNKECCLNILTATPRHLIIPCLKRIGIYDLFTNIWSCDDFGTTKSDPEIYTRAAEIIGAPKEEIIFVDDNLLALKTASLSGMRAFGIYDDASADYQDEIIATTEKYMYKLTELL